MAADSSRRRFLQGVLGAASVGASGRVFAAPPPVQTAPGTITSPLPPSPPDSRPASLGGYVTGAASNFSLQNARILVGDGTELQGGVRVENGKIVEIGAGVKSGTDLGGAVVFPGFFDGGSSIGLVEIDLESATHDDSEASDGVNMTARVVDGYNPLSALIPVARRQGVLGGLSLPNGGLVSGQSSWMRFAGETVADATIAPGGLVFNLGRGGVGALPNQPRSRMGVRAKLQELFDLNKPPDAPDPKKKPKKDDKPADTTRAQKVWHALRARELKVIFTANRADDLLVAIDLAKEFELDAVIMGAAEGHLVARQLADSGLHLVLGPVTTQPSDFDSLNAAYENPARLHAAGCTFTLRYGSPHNLRELPTEACIAVAYGLPYEVAIRASCGNHAASVWKLPVGTLAAGQPATLAVAGGDPLQPRTRMLSAWIDGREVTLRSRQTTLFERFRTLW